MYDDIQWPTPDDDEALAGINAGDGINHITVPGSLTTNISDIEETSNIDVPGIWVFRVGEGNHHICTYVWLHLHTYCCALSLI